MTLPNDWSADFPSGAQIAQVHMICPNCERPSTFRIVAVFTDNCLVNNQPKIEFHLLLTCNSTRCERVAYVVTTKHPNTLTQNYDDSFERYPAFPVPAVHPAIPAPIAEDWVEANKAMNAGTPKAAAVMCRSRVPVRSAHRSACVAARDAAHRAGRPSPAHQTCATIY